MDIVYRVGGDGYECALFAERDSAERVAQIRRALRESATWGEFRSALPDDEWEDELQYRFEFEEDPAADEPFHGDLVPGYADGDYPEWLRQSQLDWMPRELIEKYAGEVSTTVLNGDVLDLPGHRAEEIAQDLRAMGHSVERTELDIT